MSGCDSCDDDQFDLESVLVAVRERYLKYLVRRPKLMLNNICMCVCVYVCTYVYVCMYVCMYVNDDISLMITGD